MSPPPMMSAEWKSVQLFPISSIIYLIHSNVQFATLTYLGTSTYQIMGNLKIVTTGILFRLFLRRKLSNLQWMAIVLLAVGTTTSQVKGCREISCDSLFATPIRVYLLRILSARLSAPAAVYTVFLMEKNNDSLYWQNVYSTSMAMLRAVVLSVYLFNFKPTLQEILQLSLGIIICMMSLPMYLATELAYRYAFNRKSGTRESKRSVC